MGEDITSLLGDEGRRGVVNGEIEVPVWQGRRIVEVDVEWGGCTQGIKIKWMTLLCGYKEVN